MKTTSNLQSTSFAVFIICLILSLSFYIFLYLMNLSKPVYIRIFFTIASISGSALAFYGFSSLLGTKMPFPGKVGLIITGLHFILLLYTIWSNASFLANNWLFLEISIAIILLAAIGAWIYSRCCNQ